MKGLFYINKWYLGVCYMVIVLKLMLILLYLFSQVNVGQFKHIFWRW